VATAQSSRLRANASLDPLPTIPIVKAHRPGARVQTRAGIGSYTIDHASGLALSRRASRPELARPEAALPARQEQEHPSGVFSSDHWGRDDTPVALPLRKTWTIVWTALAFLLIPVAIWLLLALASKNRQGDPVGRPERNDVIAPQPQDLLAEPPAASAETAPATSEVPTPAPQRGSKSVRPAKRGGSSTTARSSPLEIRKRAAGENRLKSR